MFVDRSPVCSPGKGVAAPSIYCILVSPQSNGGINEFSECTSEISGRLSADKSRGAQYSHGNLSIRIFQNPPSAYTPAACIFCASKAIRRTFNCILHFNIYARIAKSLFLSLSLIVTIRETLKISEITVVSADTTCQTVMETKAISSAHSVPARLNCGTVVCLGRE